MLAAILWADILQQVINSTGKTFRNAAVLTQGIAY